MLWLAKVDHCWFVNFFPNNLGSPEITIIKDGIRKVKVLQAVYDNDTKGKEPQEYTIKVRLISMLVSIYMYCNVRTVSCTMPVKSKKINL